MSAFRGVTQMTKINNNLLATDRILKRLKGDKQFGVETLDDLDAVIPMIAWLLWVRAQDVTGQIQIVKGPHYQLTSITVRDAMQLQRGRFFRIAAGIIYATLSKDLDFDETKEYKVDINDGEIYVYPAFIDTVGFPFPK
jgi:hypothetical protein